MNKLSICIPVYNQASTIAATIESVLAQSIPAFEVVVSENYSTDGTREIVETYQGRLRIVRPPSHCSATDNFNFGINSCKGEWVGVCSGDDVLLPRYVELMWNGTQQAQNAVFVMGGWENFNETNGSIIPHYLLSMKKVTLFPQTVQMQLAGTVACFAAFCFKKSAFDEVGGYNDDFAVIQDWMFQFDISKLGTIVKVANLVARYRIASRAEIEIHRLPLYATDRIHYLHSKIWEAIDCGVSPVKVKLAAKKILIELLNYIQVNKIQLDQQSIDKISEVAIKTDANSQIEMWKQGKWKLLKNRSLKDKTKQILRKLYNITH
jgi:glycosyltransferase involved in cell wall biosynthesis